MLLRFVPLLLLAGCSGGAANGIPPCNAYIILFGAADLVLDCPARSVAPVIQKP